MIKRTTILALLLLSFGASFAFASEPAASGPPSTAPGSAAKAVLPTSAGPALDFTAWLNHQTPRPASSCGPNFCTQQQRTQCAQSCHHVPFVGLECCEDSCTSFCNCGSVPTGC